ncbi:vancomycin resistance protein YoaR [Barrientosiimonas humi]|uniref:Vancomycin resistance protein YoaR n=1 Tax=Barrientosiimonas humi TaxID=999931 RepID=A0A542X923_9MICO|nr:VanW family protein [Barrientosiimonas humi]TQL32337.1 vancomycin resistance protein YoaR [Barrientosiimonas humi]CAG7572328.1 hypothetical protein BH39T_PBIAJDOK_00942 [Barrientosiimonas humi]
MTHGDPGGPDVPRTRATARPTDEQPGGRSVWSSIWLRLGLTALVLVGAYLALALWQGDRIASGTQVAGVDVGGLSQDDARAKLTSEASTLATRPVTVEVGDERVQVVPRDAGLAIDVPGSLAGLGERSLNPADVLGKLTGGSERDAEVTVDRTKLGDALSVAAGTVLESAPKDGSVSIEGGNVSVVRSTPGQGIDAEAVAEEIASGWPAKTQFSAPVASRQPRLTNAEIDRFVRDVATPATSGAVTVKVDDTSAELSPRQLATVTTIKQSGGKLAATVDGAEAADLLLEQKPDLTVPARNAKATITDGKPQVTPAQDGKKLDEAKLGPAVLKAMTSSDSRTVNAPVVVEKPQVTTDDLKGIDLTSQISEFRSKFPNTPSNKVRTQNMRVALAAMNGTVVGVGQQFSLIQTLGGELTPDKGYGAAPTIQGGKERAAQGGGVSQVSTALYNAAFFAGVQLDEHKAHSFWIERYPAGREATLWVPKIDNKWTNDTDKPIVVQSFIEGDEVVIRFLGQRKYTVETSSSEKYNIRQPKTVRDDDPGCLPVPTNIGFDIDVTRVLKQGDKVVRTEKETTKYAAADRVICTNT